MFNSPTGTVTFLFTDIEGSTKRWEANPEAMHAAFARQEAILRHAIEANGGYAYKMTGDAFQAAFPTAPQALQAALDAQHSLHSEKWPAETGEVRVCMALHTGTTEERGDDYVGPALNRVARLLSAGHGAQILLSDVTHGLVRDALPPGVQLLDMGEHRLKDLIRPEHIFQLVVPGLPSEFPPLKTLDNRPNNLPLQPTPFIGREKALAVVAELISRENLRLLTLIGPGGVGKSRMALQVAAEIIDSFADGVFFVDLASTTDPSVVISDIARTVGVKEAGDQSLKEVLKHHLQDKQMLLLLDNFERVAGAALLVTQLLGSSPHVKVLVTSRVPLKVREEHEYLVPPLALPDTRPGHLPTLEKLTQYEAVKLFIERAQAVKLDFQVTNDNAPAVAEICARLDGLPLAIELAAARIRLLPPQAMLTRLQNRLRVLTGGAADLSARQQTLRGAIDWSYDLLSEGEKQLFRRLAAFAGGRTLGAIEAVCDAEGDTSAGSVQVLEIDILDGVESLVSKSLLRQEEGTGGEPRFVMLETIHEYSREKLQESGEAEPLRSQHALYFMRLAEEAEPQLEGPNLVEWLNRLEEEHDNLRAALGWALGQEVGPEDEQQEEADRIELGLRLAGALALFWISHGHYSEGRRWLDRALQRARTKGGHALPLSIQAKVIYQAANLAWRQGDNEYAMRLLEEALELYTRLDDKRGMGLSLNYLGVAESNKAGDVTIARRLWEQSLAIFRELGDTDGISRGLNNLGEVARMEGDYEKARNYYEEALALSRRAGNKFGVGITLLNVGQVAQHEGRNDEAAELFKEGLTFAVELGYLHRVAGALGGLAAVAVSRGQAQRAARLYGAEEALREAVGIPLDAPDRVQYEVNLAAGRAQLDEATWQEAWEEGRAMSVEQAIEYARERPAADLASSPDHSLAGENRREGR
jgi:predicted ATPase/class 3 adenylate cyclase/Tfp pilus assembly protein PilF